MDGRPRLAEPGAFRLTRPELTPEAWTRVQEVLLDVLEYPELEREAALRRLCGDDATLRDEVRSLLAAHENEGLLPETVESPVVGAPAALQWVGPYRILRELGRGGMGTVHLAERAGDGFTQRVALKLMRPDYADPRVVRALGIERRILARLEHPGIARFIDGGTTASGQPFIAMEYVEGRPLPAHADAAGLGVRERVALMVDVCGAVEYAHRQLVVHRDLKPANIHVTADGVAKLLDFGIATLLEEDPGQESGRETALWLTPAYASPEQLRRQPVTTLTDVYALGVVLYELVSGSSPYDFGDGSLPAITAAICDRIPDPPSVAAGRAGHAGRARAIAGDLDHVVLHALAKDPGERYGSVGQLREDLTNWLDHRPVRAGPASLVRRARGFVRRHRALALGATATLLVLVAGLTATLWQARRASAERDRAEEARGRAEEVSRFLLGLIESADPTSASGDTVAGRAILQVGLARVEELQGQPIVQADVLDALGRVLGSIGHLKRSSELHERALALRREALGERDPEVAPSLDALAWSLMKRSEYAEAEARYREALALELAAYGHDDVRVAETLMGLAFLMPYRGQEATAESLYTEATEVFTRTVGPDDRRTLVARQKLIARIRLRDLAAGEVAMRQLIADARRALGDDDPFTANSMFHLGDYIARLRPGDPEAEQWYRDGIARVERRQGPQHIALIHGLHSLGILRAQQGDYAEAEALIQRALAVNEAQFGPYHEAVAGSIGMLGWVYERAGRLAEAEEARRDMLARMERALGPHHGEVAKARAQVAKLSYRRGDLARAEALWRESIADMEEALGGQHPELARARMQFAGLLIATGRRAEGQALCAQGVTAIRQFVPPDHIIRREAQAESPHCDWDAPSDDSPTIASRPGPDHPARQK